MSYTQKLKRRLAPPAGSLKYVNSCLIPFIAFNSVKLILIIFYASGFVK